MSENGTFSLENRTKFGSVIEHLDFGRSVCFGSFSSFGSFFRAKLDRFI